MTTVISFDLSGDSSGVTVEHVSALVDHDKYSIWLHDDDELTEETGANGVMDIPSGVDIPEDDDMTLDERRLSMIQQSVDADRYIAVDHDDISLDGWEYYSHDDYSESFDHPDSFETPSYESVSQIRWADEYDNLPAGEWYLSRPLPEQIKPIAQKMGEHGESDDYIGRAVLHFIHNYNERNDSVEIFTLRNAGSDEHYGAVLIVPNEDWYKNMFTEKDQTDWSKGSSQVRTYGTPDGELVEVLVNRHMMIQQWKNSNLGVWAE